MGLGKIFFCFLFGYSAILYGFSSQQDSIKISGKLTGHAAGGILSLYSFAEKEEVFLVAEVKDGKFDFSLTAEIQPGVYRLEYNKEKNYVDLIIDGNEREIYFTLNTFVNHSRPVFSKSEENIKWYDYLSKSDQQIMRINKLHDFLSSYLFSKDKIVEQITQLATEEREKYYKYFNAFIQNNSNNWSGKMVKNNPFFFTDLTSEPTRRDFILIDYFWEGIDTTDVSLINSPLYSDHIRRYLTNFMDSKTDRNTESLSYSIKKSVDAVMQKFSGNEKTKANALFILSGILKESHDKQMISYLEKFRRL